MTLSSRSAAALLCYMPASGSRGREVPIDVGLALHEQLVLPVEHFGRVAREQVLLEVSGLTQVLDLGDGVRLQLRRCLREQVAKLKEFIFPDRVITLCLNFESCLFGSLQLKEVTLVLLCPVVGGF